MSQYCAFLLLLVVSCTGICISFRVIGLQFFFSSVLKSREMFNIAPLTLCIYIASQQPVIQYTMVHGPLRWIVAQTLAENEYYMYSNKKI